MAHTSTPVRNRPRIYTRLTEDEYEQAKHFAVKHGVPLHEYVHNAVLQAIAWENRDYDLPTAEIQRLNQLVDTIMVLSSDVESLERVITSGFDSLIGLTRGNNYLLDEEDGEL